MNETKFRVGSYVFFHKYEDYKSHDEDFIVFVNDPVSFKDSIVIQGQGKDYFYFRYTSKDEFIENSIKQCKSLPMVAGKFLVPEVVSYLDFTINDLKLFEEFFNNIDEKHKYEKIIYDAYIKNNDFIIDENDLKKAYELYKRNKNY
jgi:hypothetical protein